MLVLSGPTGIGKTRWARETFGACLYDLPLPSRNDLLRWPGFVPGVHTAVLIDEFTGQIDIQQLNRICDRYVFWARTFGGNIQIRPYVIVITTNLDVDEWWGGLYPHRSDIGATFYRRITRYVKEQTAGQLAQALAGINQWLLVDEAIHLIDPIIIDE